MTGIADTIIAVIIGIAAAMAFAHWAACEADESVCLINE